MSLILHPTSLCQWHSLLNDAQSALHIYLDESAESYLVFLLMRHMMNASLSESFLGMDLLQALSMEAHVQKEKLQAVGDKSLLYCGLFPELAKRRRVSHQYYADIGKTAYRLLHESQNKETAFFLRLSEEFMLFAKLIEYCRQC